MDILNEIEVAEIQKTLENKTLMVALKKVMLRCIYHDGVVKHGVEPNPHINFALQLPMHKALGNATSLTNEQLGEHMLACAEAVRLLEGGFDELEKFKKQDASESKKENEAR